MKNPKQLEKMDKGGMAEKELAGRNIKAAHKTTKRIMELARKTDPAGTQPGSSRWTLLVQLKG
jgi:hypothetical protein